MTERNQYLADSRTRKTYVFSEAITDQRGERGSGLSFQELEK